MRTGGNRPTVLLVEDDPADQLLVRRAAEENGLDLDLRICSDGASALAYLRREGEFASAESAPRPDLVLIDLNLPKVDGHEVLKRARSEADLQELPMLILSTSSNADDVQLAYRLGANSYITKPMGMSEYVRLLQQLVDYWFGLVRLPAPE